MQLEELKQSACRISPHLSIIHNDLKSLEKTEQECHINIQREGETQIDCTHQPYITKLSKSTRFLLKEILISSSNNNFVLAIKGVLKKGITIRK